MKITNKYNLPKAFLEMAQSDYQYKDKQYSVTSMLKGNKEAILKRRYHDEIEKDVADMVWLLFGSATHKILEEQDEQDIELKEEYIKIDIFDGYKLSGLFDLYNGETNTVIDYKTTSIWKAIYGDYEDYRKQLLIYAWMLQQIGFDCRKGQIVMFLKDWKKSQVDRKKDYPEHAVKTVEFKFTNRDFGYIEHFIRTKFATLQKYEQMKDDEIPPCTQEERWQDDDTFAVKSKGRKRAHRVLDSKEEAEKWMERNEKGDYIEHRIAEPTKCQNYCDVVEYCSWYQDYLENS